MNGWFFAVFCTFLGAAIGGLITISSSQQQKTITNFLFAASGGIVAVWVGYGLGKWEAKKEKASGVSSDLDSQAQAEISKAAEEVGKIQIFSPLLDQEMLDRYPQQKKEQLATCLSFLSTENRSFLAVKSGEEALINFHNKYPKKLPNSLDDEEKQKFYLELEQYLGLIYSSILKQNYSNLQVPKVEQSLSYPEIYTESLITVKKQIPQDLSLSAKKEIQDKIDYLIGRISMGAS